MAKNDHTSNLKGISKKPSIFISEFPDGARPLYIKNTTEYVY